MASSIVTIPAVPPNSSITANICTFDLRNVSNAKSTLSSTPIVIKGFFMSTKTLSHSSIEAAIKISERRTNPDNWSIDSSYTGIRPNLNILVSSSTCLIVHPCSNASVTVLGVIMSFTGISLRASRL